MSPQPAGERAHASPAIIVGAYAAVPEDAAGQERLLDDLATAHVDGLEIPWQGPGGGPAWDLPLRAEWRSVVTGVQRADAASRRDPAFGLASNDADGRQAALREVQEMREGILRRHDELGFAAVRAVELQTPPRGGHGTSAALRSSLVEIRNWEWDGADLIIEHCDAATPHHPAEKGFLTLEEELRTLQETPDVGVALNWGRSAIELRSADAVLEHIALAVASGRLRGVVLSGVADAESRYGPAWADAHLPLCADPPIGTRESLLTPLRVASVLDAAGPLEWVGIKMTARPPGSEGVLHALSVVRDALGVTDRIGFDEAPPPVR